MQHIAEPGAAVAEAQAEPHIGEDIAGRAAVGVGAEGRADIGEHCAADVDQPERVPVAEETLLDGEQPAALAALVAQRITAQPVVAAEQHLTVGAELMADRDRERGEGQPPLGVAPVVARLGFEQQVAELPVLVTAVERGVHQQGVVPAPSEATRHLAVEHERVAVRAEGRRCIADAAAGAPAVGEVLRALDLVAVAHLAEIVLDPLGGDPRVGELAVRRDVGGQLAALHDIELPVVVGVAGAPAQHLPGDEALRPTAVDRRRFLAHEVLVDDLAPVVARVDALVVKERRACGPARIERIEVVVEQQALALAVAVVGVVERQRPPAAAQLAVAVLEQRRGAVDALVARDAYLGAEAEQVQLFELEARGVLAARTAEGDAGVQRPDIVGGDLDIDDAVAQRHRLDARIVQVARAAQQTRGLLQHAPVVGVAGPEQQLVGDHRLAGTDVQLVGEAEEAGVLLGDGGVEDLERPDTDLADAYAGGGELGVGGQVARASGGFAGHP